MSTSDPLLDWSSKGTRGYSKSHCYHAFLPQEIISFNASVERMCGLAIIHHHECGHTTYEPETCVESPSYSQYTRSSTTRPHNCPYYTTDLFARQHSCPACLRWASLAERNRREREELRYVQAMARWREREGCLRRSTIWQAQQPMGQRGLPPLPVARIQHPGLFLGTSLPPSPAPQALAPWDLPQRAGLGRFLPLQAVASDGGDIRYESR